MSRIRPLVRDDIPQIAELHRSAFGARSPVRRLREFLADILCGHGWTDDEIPSLVWQDDDGRITGCIGVMVRPMRLDERPVRAAISHNFMVDARRRHLLPAVALIRAFLSGPQDLSLADGNATSRRLWEQVGGRSLLSHSFRWTRILRPVAGALHLIGKHRIPRALLAPLALAARAPDSVAVRLRASPFRLDPPKLAAVPIDAARLVDLVREYARAARLRPHYDEPAMAWLISTLARTRRRQTLRCIAAVGNDGAVRGWYVYYQRPGGVSRVLQLAAKPKARGQVLRSLFHEAAREGAVAVAGQVEPAWVETLRDASCLFDHSGRWMLAHSTDPAIREALHVGDLFLTRMEGESWMRFAF